MNPSAPPGHLPCQGRLKYAPTKASPVRGGGKIPDFAGGVLPVWGAGAKRRRGSRNAPLLPAVKLQNCVEN